MWIEDKRPPSTQRMSSTDAHIRAAACTLWREIKKDFLFFALCGGVVGWLMILQARLKDGGIAPKNSWADALYADFVSFNAFGLIFVGFIGFGALRSCLRALGIDWPWLEGAVNHLETRLAQLASAIIAFTAGLSICSSLHALITITGQGLALAGLIAIFDSLIVGGYVSAVVVARGPAPFDRWYVGLGILGLVLAMIVGLVLYGAR